ncbi:hypothetical protein GCM10010327_01050 [Streptomyces nitrosporeus]|nr:hypothetical protein GCM10010327_01050 [Streptomyces nitrosporeus]
MTTLGAMFDICSIYWWGVAREFGPVGAFRAHGIQATEISVAEVPVAKVAAAEVLAAEMSAAEMSVRVGAR